MLDRRPAGIYIGGPPDPGSGSSEATTVAQPMQIEPEGTSAATIRAATACVHSATA